MVQRNAERTKSRLLGCATQEFARHGFSGARVDRIAESAGVNKQLLYSYYGNKGQLFETVILSHIEEILDDVPIDALQLPEYAVQLFDYGLSHPELTRLMAWYQLEGLPSAKIAKIAVESMKHKIAVIGAAQMNGTISNSLAPAELLAVVLGIANAWILQDHGGGIEDPQAIDEHRKTIRRAVTRLITGEK